MKYKYGEYSSIQIEEAKKKMHSLVHWFLIYHDENNPTLGQYFTHVQTKLDGYNELLNHPKSIVEMMALIESARIEYMKPEPNDQVFRHLILDVHALIDKM